MIQVGQRYGMQTMDEALKQLTEQGIIGEEEAADVVAMTSDDDANALAVQPAAPKPAAPVTPPPAAETAPKKSKSFF